MTALPTETSGSAPQDETLVPQGLFLATASDHSGVIREATSELCRLSGFDRGTLIGARNETTRHADMPKALFHLMTLRLDQSLPACGYIKYRTALGGHYWAFVTVIATDNRHVSIRVRPTLVLRDKLLPIYRRLLSKERGGLSAQNSARAFEESLGQIGFANYDDFARAAMRDEFGHFAATVGKTPDVVASLDTLADLLAAAEGLADRVDRDFVTVRGEPVNMRILAGRMEGASGALGTISQNYDIMASEMQQLVLRLRCRTTGAMGRMRSALDEARFRAQLAVFLRQAAAQLDFDAGLAAEARRLTDDSPRARSEISAAARLIPDTCRQLRHRINGLNVVKLLCRVESGRMQTTDGGLDGIIARLERFHQETETNIAALSSKAEQIKSGCAAL